MEITSDWPKEFLRLELDTTDNYIVFKDSLLKVKKEIVTILEKVVKQS